MSSAWFCLNPNRPDWIVVGLLVEAIARFVLPGEQTRLDRFGRGRGALADRRRDAAQALRRRRPPDPQADQASTNVGARLTACRG